jgi:murein DD-endopeptidase MepM/ murein hydrolase activator NlpD
MGGGPVNPVGAAAGAVLAVTVAVGGVVGIAVTTSLTTAAAGCGTADPGSTTARWSQEQMTNATTIVTVGAGMQVPSYGWVIAIATALQESDLRNIDYGDRDSLGLFQQRPSQGWGTPAQIMDPNYAAAAFYRTLLSIPGWQRLPLTVAAQRVQVSAFPDAYSAHETEARQLVDTIAAQLGLSGGCAGWVLPLPADSYTLSSPFGPRGAAMHDGQDFAAPTGTPIRAAAAGTVSAAGCTSPFCDRPGDLDAAGNPVTPGCGLRVVLTHPADIATVYCHASALAVQMGQTVTAGQVIGWVGSTGNSSGPHLHFEVHRPATPLNSSTAIDPVAFLASVGVRV